MTGERRDSRYLWRLILGLGLLISVLGIGGWLGCGWGTDDDGIIITEDDSRGPSPIESQCRRGHELCDNACIDPNVDPRHCGTCGERCPEGHLCENGQCQSHDGNCPETPCTGFTYCEGESGLCKPGCVTDQDCLGGRVCNEEAHECECPDEQRLCGGVCFAPDDPDACGGECLRCPSGGETGTAQCIDGGCELSCGDGGRACDWQCVSCPEGASNTACEDGRCVATACPEDDQRVCAGECVSCPPNATSTDCADGKCVAVDCPEGMRTCAGGCADCPAEANETACDGEQCIASACPSGQLVCGGECRECPAGVEETTCDEGRCIEHCTGADVLCGGDATCTDTEVSESHCGACGNPCDDGEVCKSGTCRSRYIYTASADGTVRKVDVDGNEIWQFTGHTGPVQSVDVHPDGSIYTASDDGTVRKLDPSGAEVWAFDGHAYRVRSADVGPDGHVYSLDKSTIRKVDSSGTEKWTYEESNESLLDLAVDRQGDVYAVADLDPPVRKLDTDGHLEWEIPYFSSQMDVHEVATGERGYFYFVASRGLWKREASSGDSVHHFWKNGRAGGRAVAIDDEGAVYAAWWKSNSPDLLEKYTARDESPVWHEKTLSPEPDSIDALAVDDSHSLYVATSDGRVHKLGPSATELWVDEGHDAPVTDVAADPGSYGTFPGAW